MTDELDPTLGCALHSPGSDRTSQSAPNPIPAAPPRTEDPRAQRVRVQLELAIRELDAAIGGFEGEVEGLQYEIAFAQQQRLQLQKLLELDPKLFEHVIAVLKLEGPAGDAPEDAYGEHLAEALRHV